MILVVMIVIINMWCCNPDEDMVGVSTSPVFSHELCFLLLCYKNEATAWIDWRTHLELCCLLLRSKTGSA